MGHYSILYMFRCHKTFLSHSYYDIAVLDDEDKNVQFGIMERISCFACYTVYAIIALKIELVRPGRSGGARHLDCTASFEAAKGESDIRAGPPRGTQRSEIQRCHPGGPPRRFCLSIVSAQYGCVCGRVGRAMGGCALYRFLLIDASVYLELLT
jgi:hypothetical protein